MRVARIERSKELGATLIKVIGMIIVALIGAGAFSAHISFGRAGSPVTAPVDGAGQERPTETEPRDRPNPVDASQ